MKNKKKLQLKELHLNSFTTNLNTTNKQTIAGEDGAFTTGCLGWVFKRAIPSVGWSLMSWELGTWVFGCDKVKQDVIIVAPQVSELGYTCTPGQHGCPPTTTPGLEGCPPN